MITKTTHQLIHENLAEIETSENIRIAYACESGSRAWGFPSQDSDYDVRYIYVRPIDWYLSIEEKRDVLEKPFNEGLDINGWDLKKALKLAKKSNPPLLEWLGSPIIYLDRCSFAERMLQIINEYYSAPACFYHYLHMAWGNYREYLQGDIVWVKKYFYVLRPVLAMNWIEKGLGIVPTHFIVLVDKLDLNPELREAIYSLRDAKLASDELDKGPRIPVISDYIAKELERLENLEISRGPYKHTNHKLDEFFRSFIKEMWENNSP